MIKCLIVDDEPLAIEVIENHIAQLDDFEVAATAGNAVEAFEALNSIDVDLMFLDIQMPKLTGTEFLGSIANAPPTIFTTAYVEYALEGYELNVIDYLVKPISFARFLQAIEKVRTPVETGEGQQTQHIFVRADRKNHKIKLDDILYVESLRDYVKIHLSSTTHVVKETMTSLEDKLPSGRFLRVHRSFLVHVEAITAFTNHDVEIGEIEIPIGASYKENVSKMLG